MTAAHDDHATTGRGSDLGLPVAVGPDIASAAGHVGELVWLASRLFEITGSWATAGHDPSADVAFASASSRFAWQAGEWRRRLPVLREVDVQLLIRPGSDRIRQVLQQLAETGPDARRDALRRFVDRLDGSFGTFASHASPLRDGPVLRSIDRIRADLARLVDELSDVGHKST